MKSVQREEDINWRRGEKVVASFLMLVVGCHIVLFFVLKMMFYRHHAGKGGTVVDGGDGDVGDDSADGGSDAGHDNGGGSHRWF